MFLGSKLFKKYIFVNIFKSYSQNEVCVPSDSMHVPLVLGRFVQLILGFAFV